MNQTLQLFLHLLTLCFATTSLSKGYSSIIDELETNLENLLRDGSILGAQALVGEGDQFLYEKIIWRSLRKGPRTDQLRHAILHWLLLQAFRIRYTLCFGTKQSVEPEHSDKQVASRIR